MFIVLATFDIGAGRGEIHMPGPAPCPEETLPRTATSTKSPYGWAAVCPRRSAAYIQVLGEVRLLAEVGMHLADVLLHLRTEAQRHHRLGTAGRCRETVLVGLAYAQAAHSVAQLQSVGQSMEQLHSATGTETSTSSGPPQDVAHSCGP